MESHAESAPVTWTAPQCPFTIEYAPRVLDDIRLAVVDAFFSLPRGGAEIGGILLGRHEKGRVQILDSVELPCEHASGPSFVLSPKDHAKLAELLAVARGNSVAAQPVGWYHSHTRSEIALSEGDMEIYRRYFPEAWQVALLLKPHAFQPTRAGFFFREQDGKIQDTSCYQEFEMEPLAVRPIPEAAVAAAAPDAPRELPAEAPCASESPIPPVAHTEPSAQPESGPRRLRAEERMPRWMFVLAAILVIAFGGWGYYVGVTRNTPAPYIGLNAIDSGGQLQIRWDRNSPAVRAARDGILTIEDGPLPEAIELDPAHLHAGAFTYFRKGGRIDVTMTLNEQDGQKIHEATTYLGEDPAARRERDALTKSLEAERERARKLEEELQKTRRK